MRQHGRHSEIEKAGQPKQQTGEYGAKGEKARAPFPGVLQG
ncbi:hypothetical protein [Devosia sp. DBB001]|nr:hypothetical protein [Devosia sp. DBB001]